MGSTFLPLVKSVVNALQRWKQDLSKNEMDQLLKYIMPYLDSLLRTKGFNTTFLNIYLLIFLQNICHETLQHHIMYG